MMEFKRLNPTNRRLVLALERCCAWLPSTSADRCHLPEERVVYDQTWPLTASDAC
ncbi:MAG: hypothetical protein KatS3mg111_1477 [Pirellulaceae bacterium]|nr:MAG: hypothetical protein KatS3mg111_1477 [Pirellulaceae bacterium]